MEDEGQTGEMKKEAANKFSGSADIEGIKDTANLLLHFISHE